MFPAIFLLLTGPLSWGAERPNILFIFTDDQSHRTVSCYPEAYPWMKTPNIDALAADGVRFTHAYMGTWCMPSRATMLTGQSSVRNRILTHGGRVSGQRL
ncbi:MAG: arylsulfatase A-like enzyme [Verrucomicrobiales bacterium]|jgi:arylsulfatase A-like enzyme